MRKRKGDNLDMRGKKCKVDLYYIKKSIFNKRKNYLNQQAMKHNKTTDI